MERDIEMKKNDIASQIKTLETLVQGNYALVKEAHIKEKN